MSFLFFSGPVSFQNYSVISASARLRRGLTLVEVLIALTASLVLLGAVVSVLGMVSGSISDSRSMIESAGRLRSAQLLLRNDLAGATCNGLIWQKPEDNGGYIEIIEGTIKDGDHLLDNDGGTPPQPQPKLFGDTDDMLFMTIRSKDSQFSGIGTGGAVVKSNLAEVVWFLSPLPPMTGGGTPAIPGITTYNLHRRIFLILPSTPTPPLPGFANTTAAAVDQNNPTDISFRTSGTRVPCTLGDLTNRKNRVFHTLPNIPYGESTFPHAMTGNRTQVLVGDVNRMNLDGTPREGEDIVLSNVIGFDIKVYDPRAELDGNGVSADGITDTTKGYKNSSIPAPPSTIYGSYIDLGVDTATPAAKHCNGQFAGAMQARSLLTGTGNFVFDTWSMMYEFDGVDQDSRFGVDQGFDGLDNDTSGTGFGIVDDAGERETSPPYPYPLRGIQIKIRIYEPNSGNIREVTVEENFMNR